MILAHEIAMNEDFKLPDPSDNNTENDSPESDSKSKSTPKKLYNMPDDIARVGKINHIVFRKNGENLERCSAQSFLGLHQGGAGKRSTEL